MDLMQEINKRANFFNTVLEKFLKNGEPTSLYDAVRYIPLAGGKRLRPGLAMISCEAVSGDIKNVIPLAIAVELIHNFTLVHDDIMDKSKIRRNIPSVHIKFDEPTAIIAGDLLFAMAFGAMHDIQGDLSIFKDVEFGLIDCVREISEGQHLDMEFEKRKNITEDQYLKMILKKTAILFMYSAEAGAILGGGTKDQTNAMNEYGKSLGLGFQIHDDYLDMSSEKKILGKDIGNDIRNGKKTLIAVHCLNNASKYDKKLLERIFGNLKATDKEVKQVFELFKKVGSIEYAKNTAIKYCEKAKKAIEILPDSHAKEILNELANYSINREK